MLGPYGNTTFDTPNFNRLAARSLLFDFAFADSIKLRSAYDSFWQSVADVPGSGTGQSVDLLSELVHAGLESSLITDELRLSEHRYANFDRIIPVDPGQPRQASTGAETQLANFFAQAAFLLNELQPGDLCWLHSRGLRGAWDAPFDYRLQLADEEDPDPPTFVKSPSTWLDPADVDPDELLGLQQAAGGQIRLLDEFLGIILDILDSHPLSGSTLFCLAANRGCALGEHGLVGPGDQLFNESVQVPMMFRLPATCKTDAFRCSRLIQVGSLSRMVYDWLTVPTERFLEELKKNSAVFSRRQKEWVLISSPEHESLQTHAWKVIRSKMGGTQLFAKPDDRWEINDVSDRCPEIVEKMLQFLDGLLAENTDNRDFTLPADLAFGLA